MKTKRFKLNAGAVWLLAILAISVIAAFVESTATITKIVWLILGICGAMVAIYNIRQEEENSFLIGVGALYIMMLSWFVISGISAIIPLTAYRILVNLLVGLGAAGFIVALGLIFKIAIQK